MKQCTKCKQWADKNNFNKDKNRQDNLAPWCKKCHKEYRINHYKNNKIEKKKYNKEYYRNNKEKVKSKQKEYRENNKENLKKHKKNYNEMPVFFNSTAKYRQQIEVYEEVKESVYGYLMCKCAYCGEWFIPIKRQLQNRVGTVNGNKGTRGELRLYCSQNCKDNCPIYGQRLYSKDQKSATSREVQPELRQLVFQRDDFTCQKCNTHKDNLEVGIHCHHKEGILWEPLQSADIDMCITLCEDCHKEVHGIDGCGYQDMQCVEDNFSYIKEL